MTITNRGEFMKDAFDRLTNRSIVDLVDEAMTDNKARSRRIYKIAGSVLLMTLLFIMIVFYVLEFILIMYGVIVILFVLIMTIIYWVRQFKERKDVLYGIVFPFAISRYNDRYETKFEYQKMPEKAPEFNQSMGLFTRFASVTHQYRIDGTVDGIPCIMMHMRLVTSNGQSAAVHFDGLYTVIKQPGIPMAQIRNTGRPALKGQSFKRIKEAEDKVYLPKSSNQTQAPDPLRKVFDQIPTQFDVKHYYVSSNTEEVHIAIWPKKKIKLPKTLSHQALTQLVTEIEERHHRMVTYASTIINHNKTL